MAKTNQPPIGEPDPLVELNAEALEHIKGMDVEIERVRGDLKAIESLGLDTSKLQVHLDFAVKARQVILDRFS